MVDEVPHEVCRPRGFTLVELLVVVAIIGILVAILIPVIDRAREQAKMITCASSMRVIGQAVQTFADENGGRAPGGSHIGGIAPNGSSVSWCDILDAEVFGRPGSSYGMVRMASNAAQVQAGIVSNVQTLNCPNFVARTDYRPYAINGDADCDSSQKVAANGLMQNPLMHVESYDGKGNAVAYSGNGMAYHLGAVLNRFYPTQVLLVEQDNSNDEVDPSGGQVVLFRDASPPKSPGYAANGGTLSFRHPYYERANFLLFDGSIQTWGPTDDVLNTKLYSIH